MKNYTQKAYESILKGMILKNKKDFNFFATTQIENCYVELNCQRLKFTVQYISKEFLRFLMINYMQ